MSIIYLQFHFYSLRGHWDSTMLVATFHGKNHEKLLSIAGGEAFDFFPQNKF